ncbi:hypothetical protein FRACYDRAFT_242177 [Fragilariopsis cylindrus CCMP1102]|uniref:Uncharacterized protein n=1 Tax=Fragilariopsis cylindrus CCMP1102 TaxID=635003 RepID=A0A1E7F6T9_9STRA|nr:hypothetical protein FRACYDRAFT_242177 [Fragilariopsis cylindrus CCMP1102]|eukprot:OEU13824.1 hypothetical protein FRACYDRAFT_242177 [Fragilariopsis cylindrus CCMP1102]
MYGKNVLATTTIGGDVQQVEEQHGSIDVGVVLEEGTHHGVVNDDIEPQPVVSSREERETLFSSYDGDFNEDAIIETLRKEIEAATKIQSTTLDIPAENDDVDVGVDANTESILESNADIYTNLNANVTVNENATVKKENDDDNHEEETIKTDGIISYIGETSRDDNTDEDDDDDDFDDAILTSEIGEIESEAESKVEVEENLETIVNNVTSPKHRSSTNKKRTKTEDDNIMNRKNEMEDGVNKSVANNNDEGEEKEKRNTGTTTASTSSSSSKMTKTEEVPQKKEMEDGANKLVGNNNEEEVEQEEQEKKRSTNSASSSKMTKTKTVEVQKKKEMEGIVNNPMVAKPIMVEETNNRRIVYSGSSKSNNTKTDEVSNKMEMESEENVVVNKKPVILETETLSEEDEEGVVVGEEGKNENLNNNDDNDDNNAPSLEAESNKINENDGDEIASSSDTINNTFPTYEDNSDDGDSVIDLDFDAKEEIRKVNGVSEVKNDIKHEQEQVDININTEDGDGTISNSVVNATAQDFPQDLEDLTAASGIDTTNATTNSTNQKEGSKGSLASFFETAKAKSGVGTDSVIRQAQLLDEKKEQKHDESPTNIATDSYRGEPWGQYRWSRRLPNLELLRLVYEDANSSGNDKGKGDAESQKVLKEWRTDPLYDETMTIEAEESGKDNSVVGLGATLPVEEQDQKFNEYRSRFLSDKNDSVADANPNAKATDDSKEKKKNSNNADVNSEFVEGLDDIDDFFEGVDPPDELDVGYGSSIQDVLMDKGKHILLKKVRRVLRWIKIGSQTMGNNLKERISQFQLPFQKFKETTNVASDLNADAMNSSLISDPNEQHDKITMRDTIVSAWTVGKRTLEQISELVDRFLDRFDGESDDEPTNFKDFDGFDLDNLSTLIPPKSDL